MGDTGCAGGQVCQNGKCAPGCSVAHLDCGDAGVCDVDAGVCRSCAKDDDCLDPAKPACEVQARLCVPCQPGGKGCGAGKYCEKNGKSGAWTCLDGCDGDDDCTGDGGIGGGLCCNHVCVAGASDSANCGACGKLCDGMKGCGGGVCVDTMGDVNHCGGCGKPCQVPNGTPGCAMGKCTVAK